MHGLCLKWLSPRLDLGNFESVNALLYSYDTTVSPNVPVSQRRGYFIDSDLGGKETATLILLPELGKDMLATATCLIASILLFSP